jgi:hypothetical protein
MNQVKARVLQRNSTQYQNGGVLMQVPCNPEVVQYDGGWFAAAIKDQGIFSNYRFTKDAVAGALFDSIPVVRVIDKLNNDVFWIGVLAGDSDFTASCSVCCGDAAIPMPWTPEYVLDATKQAFPLVIPELEICPDANGNYIHKFDLPIEGNAANEYKIHVAVNGVKKFDSPAGGHVDAAALLAALQADGVIGAGAGYAWTMPNATTLQVSTATGHSLGVVIEVGNFA